VDIICHRDLRHSWRIFNRAFLVLGLGGRGTGTGLPIISEGVKNLMWQNSKISYYYCALVIFVLVFGVVRWLEGHRFGYYMRAVREGQETAQSLASTARPSNGRDGPFCRDGRYLWRFFRTVQSQGGPADGHVLWTCP